MGMEVEEVTMTDAEVRAIAKAVAHEMLEALGFDPDDKGASQKDMAFLRAWRESTNAVKRQGLVTAVGVIMIALLGLIWLAIKGPPG